MRYGVKQCRKITTDISTKSRVYSILIYTHVFSQNNRINAQIHYLLTASELNKGYSVPSFSTIFFLLVSFDSSFIFISISPHLTNTRFFFFDSSNVFLFGCFAFNCDKEEKKIIQNNNNYNKNNHAFRLWTP